VIVLSRYDRSKHKKQRLLSKCLSKKKEDPPQLFGRLLIRKSVGGERQAIIRIIAFKCFFFFFFSVPFDVLVFLLFPKINAFARLRLVGLVPGRR